MQTFSSVILKDNTEKYKLFMSLEHSFYQKDSKKILRIHYLRKKVFTTKVFVDQNE